MNHYDSHAHYSHHYRSPQGQTGVASPTHGSRQSQYRRPPVPVGRPPQVTASRPPRSPKRRRPPGRSREMLLAGGSMLALAALIAGPTPTLNREKAPSTVCQEKVQDQELLSRDELVELLSVPERSSREAVREVIDQPYCILSSVELQEGTQAEREAYPLEFDPQTWLIVLYEGGEYAGYDFSFRRD